MPAHRVQYPGELQALANRLVEMEEAIAALRGRSTVVPTLGADPDPDDPTNLWFLADGRLRGRLADGTVREWVATSTPGSPTSSVPPPSRTPDPISGEAVFPSTWGAVYDGITGARRNIDVLHYGPSGQHGNQRVMLGFDADAIAAALADARMVAVELYLENLGANIDPVWIRFGTHNSPSPPSTFSQVEDYVTDIVSPAEGAAWHAVSGAIAEGFLEGTIQGLTINQPPESVHSGYAGNQATGHTPPQLRIIYVK